LCPGGSWRTRRHYVGRRAFVSFAKGEKIKIWEY
ncbi:hypothetical protein PF007_g32134, partial [Phytophthora fragariae]